MVSKSTREKRVQISVRRRYTTFAAWGVRWAIEGSILVKNVTHLLQGIAHPTWFVIRELLW